MKTLDSTISQMSDDDDRNDDDHIIEAMMIIILEMMIMMLILILIEISSYCRIYCTSKQYQSTKRKLNRFYYMSHILRSYGGI